MVSRSMTAPFMSAMFTNTSQRANRPDRHDQKLETVHQLGIVEHEPGDPTLVVDPHRRNRQAEQRCKQRLEQRPARQTGHDREPRQHQGEEFGRSEIQSDPCDPGSEKHQHEGRKGTRDERTDRRRRQRLTRPALLRHLVSVQTGHHTRRLARRVHEDRCRRPAIHRPVIDPRHQNDRRIRFQAEGERYQKRHPRHGTDPRQNADQRPQENTDETEQQIHRRARHAEPEGHIAPEVT